MAALRADSSRAPAPPWKQRSSSDKQSDREEDIWFSPPLKYILHSCPTHVQLKANLQGDIRLWTVLSEVGMRTSVTCEERERKIRWMNPALVSPRTGSGCLYSSVPSDGRSAGWNPLSASAGCGCSGCSLKECGYRHRNLCLIWEISSGFVTADSPTPSCVQSKQLKLYLAT